MLLPNQNAKICEIAFLQNKVTDDSAPSQFLSTSAFWMIYLPLELFGLMKKKNSIIIVGCSIRCLHVLTLSGIMIVVPLLNQMYLYFWSIPFQFLDESMKQILKVHALG